MTPDFVPHDSNAGAGQAREARRQRLILAAVGAAVLVAVIAWAMKPGGQSAGRPGGRGADAGRPIPVRAVAASTGSVDITVDALGTVTALKTATIHSRVDGPLLQVPFREGQRVKAGDLLAQIDPSTFQAALNQAEGQLAKDEAQLAGARVDLDRYTGLLAKDSIARQTVDALPVEALDRDGKVVAQGTLAAVDNQIDTSTGTIRLKAQFDNTDDALFPDQFVTARLKMHTVSGATLVPSASVQRGAPGTFVYVVNADSTVSLRKLTLGPASGDLVSVQDGVKPGERVVIDGLDKLRDGAQVALIADNTRGAAAAPGAPTPTPEAHPHRRRGGAMSAPSG